MDVGFNRDTATEMASTTDLKGAKAVVSGNCDLLRSVGKADQRPPVVDDLERLSVTFMKNDGPFSRLESTLELGSKETIRG